MKRTGVGLALGAAALFGLATPAAKALLAASDPWMLAGLLYLGSGLGLGAFMLGRRLVGGRTSGVALLRADLPWLGAAIVLGGGAGPVLLMFGLRSGSASQAALLLNLEGALTGLLAWVVFREHVDARIALSLAAILAGAAILAWDPSTRLHLDRGALLVAAACLAWALDNNLTRRVAGSDAVAIAALKGTVAGLVNVVVAASLGAAWPAAPALAGAAAVGVAGYGVSLVLFVLALRQLGAARTGAYFSTAPFLGAVASVAILGEAVGARLVAAAACMAAGVGLNVTERHVHGHLHEPVEHDHLHRHDEHHRHEHAPGTPAGEPHAHRHAHPSLDHAHAHYPDLDHRHEH